MADEVLVLAALRLLDDAVAVAAAARLHDVQRLLAAEQYGPLPVERLQKHVVSPAARVHYRVPSVPRLAHLEKKKKEKKQGHKQNIRQLQIT